jgi:DNA-binding transcriptional ArsR family regulator
MHGEEQPNDPESVSDVACCLARYLRINPLAGDTREGIAQWWLGLASVSTETVERALALLQKAGAVEAVRAVDGRVRYRRVSIDADGDARLDQFIAAQHTGR